MQVVTDALVNPPRPGDPSYDLYHKEMTEIISSLRSKARLVCQRMNRIPGVQCNEIQGSMEAFPRLDIPQEAWHDARVKKVHAAVCSCTFGSKLLKILLSQQTNYTYVYQILCDIRNVLYICLYDDITKVLYSVT